MTTWVLLAWLCASPGPSGSCTPQPEVVFATRAECLRAARQARAASNQVFTHCQQRIP